MKFHEFYAKYANTPLADRFVIMDFKNFGAMTLNDVFNEINKIEDKIMPLRMKQEELLRGAEECFKNLENSHKRGRKKK